MKNILFYGGKNNRLFDQLDIIIKIVLTLQTSWKSLWGSPVIHDSLFESSNINQPGGICLSYLPFHSDWFGDVGVE